MRGGNKEQRGNQSVYPRGGGESVQCAQHRPQLFSPAFTALLAAQLFSLTGSAVARFALPLHLLNQTGSAALYGTVAAIAFMPYILCMPIGGVAADRVRKQRYMAALDALLALVAIAYLMVSGALDAVAAALAVLMLLYAGHAFYQPAVQACVPSLVGRACITRAVALVSQVSMLTAIVGPVLGGAVLGFFGIAPIMVTSAVLFGVSSALIALFVRLPDEAGPAASVCSTFATERGPRGSCGSMSSGGSPFVLFASDLRAAIAFLRHRPIMRRTIVFACLINLVLAAGLTVGAPYIVTEHLGLPNQLMGVAEASMGAGGLVGGLLAAALSDRLPLARVPFLVLLTAIGLAPLSIALLLRVPAPIAFAVMACCLAWIFACCTCVTIVLTSYLQTETPHELVGKVIAFFYAAVNCATPMGQLVFGLAFDACSPALIEVLMLLAMLSIAALMRLSYRRIM